MYSYFTKKTVIILILGISALATIHSCGGGGGGSSNSSSGGSGVAYANMVVSDVSGELGKGTFADSWSITIYSSKGYFYELNWDGSLIDSSIQFTGTGASGTPYLSCLKKMYGKSVVYTPYSGGKYYKPKNITNGTASPVSVTTNSYVSGTTVTNFTQTFPGIELEETTLSAIGIPATITAPITISFQ